MKTIETILDEFGKIDFSEFSHEKDMVKFAIMSEQKVKSFFRSALTQQLTELKEKIEEIRKQSGSEWAPERVAGKTAYNQALFDILTLIDSMK